MVKKTLKGLSQLAQLSENLDGRPDDKEFDSISLEDIYSKAQPRKVFDHLEDLGQSMKELGQQQPIVVSPDGKGKYVIEQGERRYRAAKLVGLTHLSAVIVRAKRGDSSNRTLRQLAENVQRDDMKLYELAKAIKSVADTGVSLREIATKLGKKESYIGALNAVADLPPCLEGLAEGQHIKDPVSLRRLKLAYESHPEEVTAQIEEWTKAATSEKDEEDASFVVTRAQVNKFMNFLKSLEGVDEAYPALAKKPEKKEEGESEPAEHHPGADTKMVREDAPSPVPEQETDELDEEEVFSETSAPQQETEKVKIGVYVEVDGLVGYILTPGVVPPVGKLSVMLLADGTVSEVDPDAVRIVSVNYY